MMKQFIYCPEAENQYIVGNLIWQIYYTIRKQVSTQMTGAYKYNTKVSLLLGKNHAQFTIRTGKYWTKYIKY